MMNATDRQIHSDVLQELRYDPRVSETEVGIEVDNGTVTLTGTVPNYAQKLAAQKAAHRVAGVLDVANDIAVHIPHTGAPTDTEIAQAVRDALQWDVFVHEQRISTTVSNGFITLEGRVDSVHEKRDAEKVVKALAGVKGVNNQLTVVPRQVDADHVRDAIEQALRRRATLSAHDVRVVVHDHTVTLEGKVPTWSEKKTAIDAASYIPGITDVVDHLVIAPTVIAETL